MKSMIHSRVFLNSTVVLAACSPNIQILGGWFVYPCVLCGFDSHRFQRNVVQMARTNTLGFAGSTPAPTQNRIVC